MEYLEYLDERNELYNVLLQYIESDEGDENYNIQNLIDNFQKQKILQNQDEATLFLRTFIGICNNHHRSSGFDQKIEQILQYFKEFIKNSFTNVEIFNFFKSSKQIILYLIENQIININREIVSEILFRTDEANTKYCHFFYPEIKEFLSKDELDKIEGELNKEDSNFNDKRKTGQNEKFFFELIRNDSIDEFVSYVNQTNLSLLSTIIEPSIFETNSFLIERKPSLIEYAAFFGSIQVFQYLKFNNVELNPSLWLYAIHSQNADMIHLLEESLIKPPNEDYHVCLDESIKCHHNDLARYFIDNFLNENEINYKCVLKFYNIEHIPKEIENDSVFFYLCFYEYYELVDLYLKPKEINLKDKNNVFDLFFFHDVSKKNFE